MYTFITSIIIIITIIIIIVMLWYSYPYPCPKKIYKPPAVLILLYTLVLQTVLGMGMGRNVAAQEALQQQTATSSRSLLFALIVFKHNVSQQSK